MERKIGAKDRLIFALDVGDWDTAIKLLDQLEGRVGMVKVNSLAAAFPDIIKEIKNRKMKVWRDWKHYDIPGTVANFIKADVEAKIDMTTVHILGGRKMLNYAVEARGESNLKILGITILTSYDQQSFNQDLGFSGMIKDQVLSLALLAEASRLDGVVTSAKEASILRRNLKPGMLIVTPGIKPEWAAKRKDQARVTTPREAILKGSDMLVVGSAIRKAEKPGEAADRIVEEIEKAMTDIFF